MKTPNIITILLAMLVAQNLYPQSANQTYISTRTYTHATGSTYLDQIQYYDGLGRAVQTVQKGITPSGADMATFQEYDNFGRKHNTWLPVTTYGNNGAFIPLASITTKATATYGTEVPYSTPTYESSPLNRVKEQYGAGQTWRNTGHSVQTGYLTNKVGVDTLNCIYFTASETAGEARLSLQRVKAYDSGELFVTWIKDEDGNTALEFKDKQGKVILNRQVLRDGTTKKLHDTYFVYDNYDKPVAVLPPMATDVLAAQSSAASWDSYSDGTIHKYVYLYKYDKRNRCIAKKLPGCGWIYYVYDKADRLIFSQDGEQRLKGEWAFTLPDAFDRTCVSGICKNTLNAFAATPLIRAVTVVRDSIANIGSVLTYKGYSLADDFIENPAVLTVNYYDNYSFLTQNAITGFNINNFSFAQESGFGTRNLAVKTLLTGTLTAQLGGTASADYLRTVMYYDNRKQMIQSISSNHLSGYDTEHVLYDFVGNPLNRRHIHTASGKTKQTEDYVYLYDHVGRLLETKHQLTEGTAPAKPQVILAKNTYDELGRLANSVSNDKTNLTSDFKYNIRSWINTIINPFFTEGLTYSYSGNISNQQWTQPNKIRNYTFTYDGLSRLLAATYSGDGDYSASYAYDKHGNITRLRRYGNTGTTTYGVVDSLTMNYSGNRLVKTNDSGAIPMLSSSADFRKYASGIPEEYTYDTNGNLKSDRNKGLTDIMYNSLNLPVSFTISNALGQAVNTYVYTASGKKLHVEKGSFETDYVGNMIYENGVLKRILVDNGYYENENYYFYVKDHLGNNRVVADQNGNIVQSTQYYPFGMAFADGNTTSNQSYKYNGKELDSDRGLNWYDYEARQMEPTLGRFTTMDPLAEKYYSVSPYVYCANNPVNRIDPDGRDWFQSKSGNNTIWVNSQDATFVHNDGLEYHNIGTEYKGLTVYGYERTSYNTESGNQFSSLEIKIGYNDPNTGKAAKYNWIQTVTKNDYSTFVDPKGADKMEQYPFYQGKDENELSHNKDGFDITFYDKPNEKENNGWFRAELSLIGDPVGTQVGNKVYAPNSVSGGKNIYSPIVTMTYGFSVTNRKLMTSPIRIVSPSLYHRRIIEQIP